MENRLSKNKSMRVSEHPAIALLRDKNDIYLIIIIIL